MMVTAGVEAETYVDSNFSYTFNQHRGGLRTPLMNFVFGNKRR